MAKPSRSSQAPRSRRRRQGKRDAAREAVPGAAIDADASESAAAFRAQRADWIERGELADPGALLGDRRLLNLAGTPSAAHGFILTALTGGSGASLFVVAECEKVRAQEELAHDLEAWGTPFLFFPQAEPTVGDSLPDQELAAERLAVLETLANGWRGLLLATTAGLEQSLPTPETFRSARLELRAGEERDRDALIAELEAAGYSAEAQVEVRGTYSMRGAVLDIFGWQGQLPLRTEWMGDEVESIREFDPVAQRSVREIEQATISLAGPVFAGLAQESTADSPTNNDKSDADQSPKAAATLADYLPADAVRVLHYADPELSTEEALAADPGFEFFAHDFLHAPRGDFIMREKRRDLFLEHLEDWLYEKWEVAIFCNNEGEEKRLTEIMREVDIDPAALRFYHRPLLRGFAWPAGKLVILSDAEIFGRYQTLRALRKQERLTALRANQENLNLSELAEGDTVVHSNHGIAIYGGLQKLPGEGPDGEPRETEALVLIFANEARLFVPVEQAYLVSRYVGVGKRNPPLDTLGGNRWERAKASARKAVMDYAARLLATQAERDTVQGFAFGPDTPWQEEFESAFIYKETEDQIKAIAASKQDMEQSRPMDRLICGDVGFGKTEVAIRAAFKAIMDGKQVAFLVPTTVLAQQHFENLRDRFADYPIQVETLSRFRTKTQQKDTLENIKCGSADLVVGTHRLLSKDVQFPKLGLVIVDEEQRFGVAQKEKLKEKFKLVDVLTLSATPIPRTLYLALTGARDLSTIETAPANRQSVETIVAPYDERTIREAIERELARDGQVYFLHNRVQSIQSVAERIRFLVPKARVDVGHGQMTEGELEQVMHRFVEGETDILLATTIIESGLDIPNANTILIDRADRFGLADLYQLRGRVGRSEHKAYAYLFLPRHLMTSGGDARKRVSALRQYSQLGSGFKIAMRDLEIRGAGNLLGTAQSGHITAVGFDLYCRLLKTAVSRLKGEPVPQLQETKLALDFLEWQESEQEAPTDAEGRPIAIACLPRGYMKEHASRIQGYRRLAELRTEEEIDEMAADWRDRFGPLPESAELLLEAARVRLKAAERAVRLVETQGTKLMLKQRQDFVLVGGKFPRLTQEVPSLKLREICQWIEALVPA